MKLIYCQGCREWFDHKRADCPECGWVRPGYNKWLRTAKLNNHLYGLAEHAEAEKKVEQQLRAGR
jgi:hypothetical protein